VTTPMPWKNNNAMNHAIVEYPDHLSECHVSFASTELPSSSM